MCHLVLKVHPMNPVLNKLVGLHVYTETVTGDSTYEFVLADQGRYCLR